MMPRVPVVPPISKIPKTKKVPKAGRVPETGPEIPDRRQIKPKMPKIAMRGMGGLGARMGGM
jgi:hypothetical protein